jgi:hypothetical protein
MHAHAHTCCRRARARAQRVRAALEQPPEAAAERTLLLEDDPSYK